LVKPAPRIVISCGEASGDMYAGALVDEIKALRPRATFAGFGGERLAAAGAALLGDYRGLSVTGLSEALKVLPRSYGMYRRLLADARRHRPDVFVAIDFPDFNFRVASGMRRLGVPVVYYISPQLWAWRGGRMKTMRRIASRVLVIFPFEEPLYRDAGVPVTFVGHPLPELTTRVGDRAAFLRGLGLKPNAPLVALLPGSRPNEVQTILPTLVEAAELMAGELPDVQFLVARAPHLDEALFAPLRRAAVEIPTVEGLTDHVLSAADVALTASGTATVQAAIHECPMVIVYRLSSLTYRLGKPFVRVNTFGMVNLIAGRRVAPELIQDDFTAEEVSRHALALMRDQPARERAREGLREVRAKLGAAGASRRAAEEVLRVADTM
jgi:lipid-A-disaccharide synthase